MNSSISMLALFSLLTGGWNFDRPLAVVTSHNCEWVGRILRVENSQIEAGKLLCAQETLEPEPNARVTVLCYETGKTLDVPSGTISMVGDRCNPPSPILFAYCPADEDGRCRREEPRGDSDNRHLTIIRLPSRTRLLEQTPTFSWDTVDGATEYRVTIRDSGRSRPPQTTTVPASDNTTITLNFPPEFTPLWPDKQYELSVAPTIATEMLPPSVKIFFILSEEDAAEIEEIKTQLDRLDLSQEEKVLLDLHHLYRGRRLDADAIDSLKELTENGSQNPQAFRMLGELYEKHKWWDLALSHYKRATELAAGNHNELEKSREGIERIRTALEGVPEEVLDE